MLLARREVTVACTDDAVCGNAANFKKWCELETDDLAAHKCGVYCQEGYCKWKMC